MSQEATRWKARVYIRGENGLRQGSCGSLALDSKKDIARDLYRELSKIIKGVDQT